MNQNDKKYILKKLMQDALAEEEVAALNDRVAIKERMGDQWENAPDAAAFDRIDGMHIWQYIRRRIEGGRPGKTQFYKIYSAVASISLLLALGGMTYLFLEKRNDPPMYIVSSGIQNMQSVSLPDGTEVQLGPGSKLTYPSEFSSGKREVSLDGQAFFDVYKNPHKPFVVHTADMDIEALGTAFEVFSYGIENKSEAILLNGKIRVNCNGPLNNKNGGYLLSPDEKIVFDKRDNSASVQDVDADKYTAWRKQRILSFENEKLSMIIPRLEQWYGRKIMCQQDLADKYRFTFKIRDESLERILFMMGASSPLKYKETSNGNYQLILK